MHMHTTERTTICVVLPTWVGDACLATPALRALRQAFPSAQLVGVMRPIIRELLEGAWGNAPAWLDDCIVFSKKAQAGASTRWGLIRQLRRRQPGVVVLLTNSLWSAAVARCTGAKRIVGYDRDARGWLLSDRLPIPREGQVPRPISPIDYYLQLAGWLGAETGDRSMQLSVSDSDRQLGDELWSQIGFTAAVPTIVINSGSATMATRLWPVVKVQQLAHRIAAELGWQVLLHCGPAEREAMNGVATQAGDARVASMGVMPQLPMGLSRSVLHRAATVVTTDSGPRHMAVALNRPVVTLFGSTDSTWTRTYNIPEIEISESLDCRPCYKSPCPLVHHRCMQDISVERVMSVVKTCVAGQATINV